MNCLVNLPGYYLEISQTEQSKREPAEFTIVDEQGCRAQIHFLILLFSSLERVPQVVPVYSNTLSESRRKEQ